MGTRWLPGITSFCVCVCGKPTFQDTVDTETDEIGGKDQKMIVVPNIINIHMHYIISLIHHIYIYTYFYIYIRIFG